MIVAVDTMTLIWGIRHDGPDTQCKRARWLFRKLDDEGAQVVIPSVSLSEYLVPLDPAKRSAVATQMSERFIVAPFDLPSSVLAATLFVEERGARKGNEPNARKVLRADCLIVATAKVHGATRFFSEDKECRSIANRAGLEGRALPDAPEYLFDL